MGWSHVCFQLFYFCLDHARGNGKLAVGVGDKLVVLGLFKQQGKMDEDKNYVRKFLLA